MTDTRYKDFSMSFKPHPLTGDLTSVVDSASINQSIRNIILTMVGEVPFSEIGSSVKRRIFENFDAAVKRDIEEDIKLTIIKYEPRVVVNSVTLTADDIQMNSIIVTIVYEIRTINDPVTFTMFLKRA